MRPNMLIFGFGYTANFLAKKLAALEFHVVGTSRNQELVEQHTEKDYELINFTQIDIEKSLSCATHILVSTPPSPDVGDPVLAQFTDLIKKYAASTQWLGYLSSTGVYGDHQGRWVDEASESLFLGQQAKLRLNAEKAWISLAQQYQLPLHIFRIAGIYGPQRNALTRIAQGKIQTVYKENHFFSRIHVADIATVLIASIKNPKPISIYNVADDEPAPSHEVDAYAAHLLNVPALERVPFELAVLSPMAKEFYAHHRRVSNAKIKQELLVNLKYPTYREGLQHLYDTGGY
ncbi:MAG: SDR family oxidoreductase [Legionella sp.]|nr:SDR family oxidoreductase [Legionella sp.]